MRPSNETSNGVTGAMQPKPTSNFPHGTNNSPQSVNPYAQPFEGMSILLFLGDVVHPVLSRVLMSASSVAVHYGSQPSVPHNSNPSQVPQGQVIYPMANHQQQASPSQIQASSVGLMRAFAVLLNHPSPRFSSTSSNMPQHHCNSRRSRYQVHDIMTLVPANSSLSCSRKT